MKTYLFIIIISSLLFSFCTKKTSKPIIPREDLVSILIDLQKIDGLLTIYKVRKEYEDYDKKEIYNEVFEQRGYTREQFDTTIKYYSKNKLLEFERIFEEVVDELNRIENQEIIKPSIVDPNENLWNKRPFYKIPKGRNKNKVVFSIPIEANGIYTIKAKIKIYKDDESLNPRIRAYFWHKDTSSEGFRDYFELNLKKTDYYTTYMISRQVPNDKVTHLKGWLLFHDENEEQWVKHAELKDIAVKYTPLKPQQEEIFDEKDEK